MLRFKNKKTRFSWNFYVMDSHHHIGRDVDGAENNPLDGGTYSFSKKVYETYREILKKSSNKVWTPLEVPDGRYPKPLSYNRIMEYFSKYDPSLEEKYDFLKSMLIDKFIVFPMKDVFKDDGDYEYSKSNEYIRKWSSKYPHSLRFFGFCRINPNDLEGAKKELKKVNELGILKGVKMHPESETFSLDEDNLVEVIKLCSKYYLPMIFHTSYPDDVIQLKNSVNKAIISLIKEGRENQIGQIKIIVGHFSYNNKSTLKLLNHPCLFGELSTLREPREFFVNARKFIKKETMENELLPEIFENFESKDHFIQLKRSGRFERWSEKLLLGSDYPFLPLENLVKIIRDLFSGNEKSYFSGVDIQNILAGNILNLIPIPKIEVKQRKEYKNIETKRYIGQLVEEKKNIIGLEPVLNPRPFRRISKNTQLLRLKFNDEIKSNVLFERKIKQGDQDEVKMVGGLIVSEEGNERENRIIGYKNNMDSDILRLICSGIRST